MKSFLFALFACVLLVGAFAEEEIVMSLHNSAACTDSSDCANGYCGFGLCIDYAQEGEACGLMKTFTGRFWTWMEKKCDAGLQCATFNGNLLPQGVCHTSNTLRSFMVNDAEPEPTDDTPMPDTPSSLFITGFFIGVEGQIGTPELCFNDAPKFSANLTTFFHYVADQKFSISSIKPIVSNLADLLGNIRITSAECGLTKQGKKIVQFILLPVVTIAEQSWHIFKYRSQLNDEWHNLMDAAKQKDYLSAGLATGKFLGLIMDF